MVRLIKLNLLRNWIIFRSKYRETSKYILKMQLHTYRKAQKHQLQYQYNIQKTRSASLHCWKVQNKLLSLQSWLSVSSFSSSSVL
ncbi:hypothetical protein FGO68_gene14344 [Halteria grandinella]|uniref:Uncharacterized protein n=1 Tax=Halteria grandinella TaxID=5974 RepID=A0A8J8T9A1_HALGN|nr:hypothetical protein FGO68_gene14344 [Halteria grandinella]